MTKLSEIFAAPKGELQPVWKYAGKTFYSSSELRKKYLITMSKTSKSAPIIRKIMELMEKGMLIPVYKDKSFWKSILKLSPIELKDTAGLAFPTAEKVFVFVEEGSNIFSFTSNDAIASVTLHELIHLISHKKSTMFYAMFNDELVSFYKYYFCKLLNCDMNKVNDMEVDKLVRYIYFEIENKKGIFTSNDDLHTYYNTIALAFQKYTSLSQNDFFKILNDYIVFIKLLQKFEAAGYPQAVSKVIAAYNRIVSPLEITYKYVFSVDVDKEKQQAYQEIFSPSEVISLPVVVKKPNPKVYKAISQL